MTSLDDQILIAVRDWILAATDLPGDRVVPADDSGTRPNLPYITIRILTSDNPTAWAEKTWSYDEDEDRLDQNIIGRRRGSIQLDGYGRGAYQYLADAALKLEATPVRRVLRGHGLTVHKGGVINDISQLVDDEIEKRYQRDHTITYAVTFKDAIEDAAPVLSEFAGDFEFDGDSFTVVEDS